MAKARKKVTKKKADPKLVAAAEPCVLTIPERVINVSTPYGTFPVTIPAFNVELPPCCTGCCEACDALETGKWGILWRDASGEWHCLEGPTGTQVLKGDGSGPFWANP